MLPELCAGLSRGALTVAARLSGSSSMAVLARSVSTAVLPSADRSLATLPLAFAEYELLHLSRRGPRKLSELDRGRALEACEMIAAEGDQLVFAAVPVALELHERLGALAPLLIRHCHDRRLQDRRMLGEDLLDLDAGDVLPA